MAPCRIDSHVFAGTLAEREQGQHYPQMLVNFYCQWMVDWSNGLHRHVWGLDSIRHSLGTWPHLPQLQQMPLKQDRGFSLKFHLAKSAVKAERDGTKRYLERDSSGKGIHSCSMSVASTEHVVFFLTCKLLYLWRCCFQATLTPGDARALRKAHVQNQSCNANFWWAATPV